MTDASIHHDISALVEREHQLRSSLALGGSEEDRAALRQVEESLDQCWDLLRQREARRDAGENPDAARGPSRLRGRGLPPVGHRGSAHSTTTARLRTPRHPCRRAEVSAHVLYVVDSGGWRAGL